MYLYIYNQIRICVKQKPNRRGWGGGGFGLCEFLHEGSHCDKKLWAVIDGLFIMYYKNP